jgi:3',5'-cyclic AMP phosphodiesterase CpdA
VTHHPFDLPEGHNESDLVGRARMAMETLASCGADLFLAGHLHVSHTMHTATRYRIKGHSALVVQAGTATSSRGRGEENSFNLIRIDKPKIEIDRYTWNQQETFEVSLTERFQLTPDGWVRAT